LHHLRRPASMIRAPLRESRAGSSPCRSRVRRVSRRR
jgi:hypothetical protein